MNNENNLYDYAKRSVEYTKQLLGIDSPTGYTDRAAEFVKTSFSELGFAASFTAKGGVIVDLGGDAVLLQHGGKALGGQLRLMTVPAALENESFFHGRNSFPYNVFWAI